MAIETVVYRAKIDGVGVSSSKISYKMQFLGANGKPDACLGYLSITFDEDASPAWHIKDVVSVTIKK